MQEKQIKMKKHFFVSSFLLKYIFAKYNYIKLRSKNAEQIFTEIFRNNSWNGKDSVSGPGSDFSQTRNIVKELPLILRSYRITSLLDIPCGDFHWMNNVDLKGVNYTGADIVQALIANNEARYAKNGVNFQIMDISKSQLPTVDLVLCRDCLVHLSFDAIFRAFSNVCNSQSNYFLSTTFTERTRNFDIPTGLWRTLNLELAPFHLPKPIRTITEGYTGGDGAFMDKALGLWKISDIQECLKRRRSDRFFTTL